MNLEWSFPHLHINFNRLKMKSKKKSGANQTRNGISMPHIFELGFCCVYSRGLLVVIGNVDNVDGLSLRVFDAAINCDVCIRFVIWLPVNGAIVVWIVSTLVDVDVAIEGGETVFVVEAAVVVVTFVVVDVVVVVNAATAAVDTSTTRSPFVAPSIEGLIPLLLLSRVNDSDNNDASTTCSALASLGIVFDTTNSFIVPL